MMNLSIQLLINDRDRVYLSRLSNEEEVHTSPPPPPPPSLLDEQPPSQLAQPGEEGNDEEEEYEDNGILDYDEELPLNSTSPSKMMHEQRYV